MYEADVDLGIVPPRGSPKRFAVLIQEVCVEYEALIQNSYNGRAVSKDAYSSEGKMERPLFARPTLSGGTQSTRNNPGAVGWLASGESFTIAPSLTGAENRWAYLTKKILQSHRCELYIVRDCWEAHRPTMSGTSSRFESVTGGDVVEGIWKHRLAGKAGYASTGTRFGLTNHRPGCKAVHPDSLRRLLWAAVGLLFIIMDLFYLTMSVFGMDRPYSAAIVDCAYWTIDVVLNFLIGFHDKDRVQVEFAAIRRKYFRTWFAFDFSLMVAGWPLALLRVDGPSANLLRYFRLVRLSRLLRFSKFTHSIHQLLLRVQSDWATLALKMVGYMLGVLIWIHASASFYYWIGDRPGGWTRDYSDHLQPPMNYIISVHWAASQLQGGIDIYPAYTVPERTFAVVNLLASIGVLALSVSKATTTLSAMQVANRERNRFFNSARQFVETNSIRPEVGLAVYRYLEKRQQLQVREGEKVEEEQLLMRLPFNLRRRVLEEARWPVLSKHLIFVAFSHFGHQFRKVLLCDVVQTVVYLPDELLFHYGGICSRVLITMSGEAHYTRYARTFAALMAGSKSVIDQGFVSGDPDGPVSPITSEGKVSSENEAFQVFEERHRQLQGHAVPQGTLLSEASIWTSWAHVGDFEAVGELGLFSINCHSFLDLVQNFPAVQHGMRTQAHRFLDFLRSCEEPSDLITTDQIMALSGRIETCASKSSDMGPMWFNLGNDRDRSKITEESRSRSRETADSPVLGPNCSAVSHGESIGHFMLCEPKLEADYWNEPAFGRVDVC